MTERLRLDGAMVEGVAGGLDAAAAALHATAPPLTELGRTAMDGAGQFSADLQPGAATFSLAWGAVTRVYGDSAAAVAGLARRTNAAMAEADRQLVP